MMVLLYDMPIDQIHAEVGPDELLGEHGQVHLAAVRMAAKR
jgi:hypothetical protein